MESKFLIFPISSMYFWRISKSNPDFFLESLEMEKIRTGGTHEGYDVCAKVILKKYIYRSCIFLKIGFSKLTGYQYE